MRRKTMNMMRAKAKTASRTTAPQAGSLLRCAFACVLALSLALPAEGISAAFAADIPVASPATVSADGGSAAGSAADAVQELAADASAVQDAPAVGSPAVGHPSANAPLLMSLHGARTAEAEPAAAAEGAAPAAEGDGSDGSEAGAADPDAGGTAEGGPGSDGSDPDAGGPDASEGDGPDAPDGDGAESEADGDDPVVMAAPEEDGDAAEAGEPSLLGAGAAPAGAVCQIIRTSGGTETFVGTYAAVKDAFVAAQANDRIEMLRDADLPQITGITIKQGLTWTTSPASNPVAGAYDWSGAASPDPVAEVTRSTATSGFLDVSGSIRLEDIVIKGAPGIGYTAPLFANNAKTELNVTRIVLGRGAVVRDMDTLFPSPTSTSVPSALLYGTSATSSPYRKGLSEPVLVFEDGCRVSGILLDGLPSYSYGGPGLVKIRGAYKVEIKGGVIEDVTSSSRCSTVSSLFSILGGSGRSDGLVGRLLMSGGLIKNCYTSYFESNDMEISGGEICDSSFRIDARTSSSPVGLSELRLYGGYIHDNITGQSSTGKLGIFTLLGLDSFKLQGDPVVIDNRAYLDGSQSNVMISGGWLSTASFQIVGPVSPTARVGLTALLASDAAVQPGAVFGHYAPGCNNNIDVFSNDWDPSLVPVDAGGGNLKWGGPNCQIIRENASGTEELFAFFGDVQGALGQAADGDRIEMLDDASMALAKEYPGSGSVTLATAPAVQPVSGALPWQGAAPAAGESPKAAVTRSDPGAYAECTGGGTLRLENIAFDGGWNGDEDSGTGVESEHALLYARAGSTLVLGDGSVLRDCRTEFVPKTGGVFTTEYMASGAVADSATVRVEAGSEVFNCTTDSRAEGGVTVLRNPPFGGAISDSLSSTGSVIEVSGGDIHDNYAVTYGGAVAAYAQDRSTVVRVSGGDFHDNESAPQRAAYGGGVYAGFGPAVYSRGEVFLSGGDLHDNVGDRISAVYANVLHLSGGTVRDNSFRINPGYQGSGGISVASKVYVSGSPVVRDNGNPFVTDPTAKYSNLCLASSSATLVVDGALAATADVGVRTEDAARMADGEQFGSYDPGFGANVGIFKNDSDAALTAVDWKNGQIRWGYPSIQIVRPNASGAEELFGYYGTLGTALGVAQAGDRVELLKDVGLPGPAWGAWASGTVELTTAPAVQPVAGALPWQGPAPAAGEAPRAVVEVANAATARIDLSVGGGLEVGRVAIEGASGAPALAALFTLDRSSSLAFGDGAEVKGFSNQLVTLANSSGAAAGCTVSFAPGCSVHDVGTASPSGYLIGYGGVVYAGSGANARIEVTGGEFYDCATGIGGVFAVEAGSEIEVTGGDFHGNEAGMGGVIRSSGGSLRLLGGEFHGNKAVIHGTGTPAGAGGAVFASGGSVELGGSLYVHGNEVPSPAGYDQLGAGLIVYAGTALKVSGAPRVTGNSVVDSSTGAVLGASNLVTGASVDVTGLLAPTASVGVTAPSGSDLAGQQFGAYVSGASANLDRFTNDLDPALVGSDGGSGKVVWRMGLVDASFTKVGASQEPGAAHGLYAGLPGARFSVYEYVGTTPLTQAALDASTVGPAGTASSDWAPLLDAAGTVGAAGNASNVPHDFVSDSNGKVDVKKVKPNAWYMLVETQAPAGFQLPQGQWAFRVSDPDGDGTFDIDASSVLACKGPSGGGGSLPPAMATSVSTSSGTKTGVFVVNTPRFGLPHAGVAPELPLALLAGAALVGMAWALHRLRRRSRRV